VSVCGDTPFQRPYYWCAAGERGWVPADEVLGFGSHQILSAELQAWVAETGDELPFEQAAERLERLAGIGLGIETVRTHTKQVGSALAERQRAAAATVAQTQEAARPVDTAPELLVVEVDGVHVRFQDGWHEAKVGEIAGCQVGNGLPDADPAARPPRAGGAHVCGQPLPSWRVRLAVPGRKRPDAGRLAAAAHARQSDEPRACQPHLHVRQHALPANETGQRRRQIVPERRSLRDGEP
jgi:hypothetical protein